MVSPEFQKRMDQVYKSLREQLPKTRRDYDWRIQQLHNLKRMLVENDEAFCQAMWADLRKSKFECVTTEQGLVISEIDFALKNLAGWMKPRRVHTPLVNFPGSCEVRFDPLGLALIIGAWNYPINLLLAPLVGAICGGNAVILKPSELAVQSAKLIAALVPKYLDDGLIAVIEAGPEETSLLLDQKFDTIFFTGSGTVGKIVMQKAAVNLTPVTLELGGKSPALVMKDADIEVTGRRIAWGKFMNAGQTCIAPDYVMVQPSVKDQLIAVIQKSLRSFYGENVKESPDYCRIVNQRNFDRLQKHLTEEKIISGGEADRDQLFIEPTLVTSTFDSKIMEEEIFGPILPVIEVDKLESMISFINSRPKPLSLYLFTGDDENEKEKVLTETSAGGVCVNDVVMHMPVPTMPFGGVGASGMGHYHGKYSFEAFTHAKGVLKKGTWLDIPLRYAPYSLDKIKWIRRFI